MQRVIFANQFESMWTKALKTELTPSLRAQLKQCGFDPNQLQPVYPFSVWEQCLALTAAHLYPKQSYESAYEDLGYRMVQSYFDSVWGSHFIRLLRMLGPKRMILRTQSIFRTSNNYAHVTVTEVGPMRFELSIDDYGREIYFTRGVIRAGIEKGGANDSTVEITKVDERGVTYVVSFN
jgi:uncharacterized protein (TIGR02265 family)